MDLLDNNHFDLKIFVLTMTFLIVSDVSIYSNLSVPLSSVAVLRTPPFVAKQLPAVMEASPQLSNTQPNYPGLQQFAFSSDFSSIWDLKFWRL